MPLTVVEAQGWRRIESTGFLATRDRDVWLLLPRSNRRMECCRSTISSDPGSGQLFSVTAERPIRTAASWGEKSSAAFRPTPNTKVQGQTLRLT